MTRAFWIGFWVTAAIVCAAMAWMSMNANDAAHEAEKADINAGRFP